MTAVPIPQRCAGRPAQGGLVVPWISLPLADGTFDLGNMHTSKVNTCFYQRRCQICGDRILGRTVFFVPESKLDAMWAGEPPLHPECAAYSAKAVEDLDLFGHVPQDAPDDPRARWDGHSTEEKYERLAALAARPYVLDPTAREGVSDA